MVSKQNTMKMKWIYCPRQLCMLLAISAACASVSSLFRLLHECVLPLVGYSCDGPSLCLVYPLMSRGSLDRYIGDVSVLPPPQRMRIATDIGRALAYIHHGIAHKVVLHRDVKR